MFNNNYESVYNISALGDLVWTDAHEIFLTPQCTAVISLYQPRSYNLTHLNITDGWLLDSYIQEIDIASNELLFEWRSSDHVNVTDSVWAPELMDQGLNSTNGFDFFHINSIEKDQFGNYLISARHMNALYYIDGQTGDVIWTLGGLRNDFTDLSNGTATNFAWQHHARWTSSKLNSVSLFDDRNTAYHAAADPLSRGIILDLDTDKMTVTLSGSYPATNNITSVREGSMQTLPDTAGNVLLGYGDEPAFTEFSANGTVLWDVTFGPFKLDRYSADNYRALKVNWTGAPLSSPKIAAGPAFWDGKSWQSSLQATATLAATNNTASSSASAAVQNDTAYVSWNGATEVVAWALLATNASAHMNLTQHFWKRVPKRGFETSARVAPHARYVRAVALSAADEVLGASPVLDMLSGVTGGAEELDLEAATAQWRELIDYVDDDDDDDSLWSQAGTVVGNLKDKWQTAIADARTRKVVIAGVVVGVCALVLIGIGTWLALRWLRRKRSSRGVYRSMARDNNDEESRVEQLEKLLSRDAMFAIGDEAEEDDDTCVGSLENDRGRVKDSFSEDEGDLSCLVRGSGDGSRTPRA
ncbi:hypothetical protein MBLNU459_g2311t2 [Dothideomycetes sp. NU459]